MEIKKILSQSERIVLRNLFWKGRLWQKIVLAGHKETSNPADSQRTVFFGIFIHDRTLGPALGGLRVRPDYPSFEAFFEDGLLLSEAMSYKASLAGLDLGGGKAVIWANPQTEKTDPLLKRIGLEIKKLRGDYITAEDMGTNTSDMEKIAAVTEYVAGRSAGSGGSGDPSLMTSLGILQGIKACLQFLCGNSSLSGRTFAVQGIGNCGFRVARHIHEAGGLLIISDQREDMTKRASIEFGAKVVPTEEIYDQKCNVFVPCATGGILNEKTIPRLKCEIIAGSANNQLADEERDGKTLFDKGIVYAPDYAINAGGLINVAQERASGGYNELKARMKTMRIYDIILNILNQSKEQNIPPYAIASREAKKRIEAVRTSKKEVDNLWELE